MSHFNLDAPRIGTPATVKPYMRVDSRECRRCGAVAGRCEHLQADTDIIWVSTGREKAITPMVAWPLEEREAIKRMFEAGYNASEIAEVKNTTRSAVCGMLRRMGVRRGV